MSCVSNLLTNCCKFRVTSQLVLVNQSKDHKPVSKWLQRIWIFYQIFLVPRSWHQLVTCIVSTFLGCLIPVSKGSGNHRLLKRVLEHTSQLHAYIKVKIRPETWDLRAFGKNFTSGEGLASKTWISLLHTASQNLSTNSEESKAYIGWWKSDVPSSAQSATLTSFQAYH
jgi:hypothetical protein